jgi:hypothetical protein
MNHTFDERFNIHEEIRLIPKGIYVVALVAFLGVAAAFQLAVFHKNHPVIAALPGMILAFLIILIGYVNRDAKRRGMNHVLWTILVLVVPNAIGFIIYFIIRQPIQGKCLRCGTPLYPEFNFCPKCKFNLHPTCPQCHRAIELGAVFCPYCSADLKGITLVGQN